MSIITIVLLIAAVVLLIIILAGVPVSQRALNMLFLVMIILVCVREWVTLKV